MATETLKMLNLSPIPELSEMELSTILEHLNSVSDLNGEVTDHNVEDILREAEELIDKSSSVKADSLDSKKYENNCVENNNSNVCKENTISNIEDSKLDDSESINEMLNISLSSDNSNEKDLKSESPKSVMMENNTSRSDLYSPTPRSITNHIQSTLDSLRECSKKIENQSKTSFVNSKEDLGINLHKKNENTNEFQCGDGKISEPQIMKRGSNFGEESVKESAENLTTVLKEKSKVPALKTNLKLTERNKSIKKTMKGLSLNESLKTLDCFERLYRGRPSKDKVDYKGWRTTGRITNDKKTLKIGKKNNPHKFEVLRKDKKLRDNVATAIKNKQHDNNYHCSGKTNLIQENLTDEEISFEKCLSLLQEESDHSNAVDMTSFNYLDFTENIFKHWARSVSALQGEVDDLKSQLKRNETKNSYLNADSHFASKFLSQENLIHKLKEENMKLFKEVEDIKGQLKMGGVVHSNGDLEKSKEALKKFETVDTLRDELKSISRSLTSYSETNGILRLEEQFSSLKAKYDEQIGKLENENKKLKEVLANQSPRLVSARNYEVTKLEVGVQTDRLYENVIDTEFDVDFPPRKDPIRGKCVEVCENNAYAQFPGSFKTVDVATSPIKSAFSKADKELCSVSVQCRGESDLSERTDTEDLGKKIQISKNFHKLENKENISNSKKSSGKTRMTLNCGNQMLNLLKQKKMSEHENQLMATVRALHSEITVKDRDNKKMKNELELLRNQIKRIGGDVAKHKSDLGKKCHVGTQTIALVLKMQEAYDPLMFQVSRELEEENEELKSRLNELEKVINLLKDKRINDLQILQKIHEEEIDKLASRLKSQTALTNHLHSLLTGVKRIRNSATKKNVNVIEQMHPMSDTNNGKAEDEKKQAKEEETDDEVFEEASSFAEVDVKTEPVITTESVANKDKKGKTLRFALPEKSESVEITRSENRDYQEFEIQNVVGFRTSPLPFPQLGTISDVMQAMHADVSEDDSSSIYSESENRVIRPPTFAYKPIFDALRRSPTRSQADYHLLMSAYLRNVDGVMQALEDGANVNVVQDMQTPLIIATENNDKPLVSYLLTIDNINLNCQNIYGSSALLIAIRSGFDESPHVKTVVKWFDYVSTTAKCISQIATLLIKNKARLDVVNNLGRAPLHEALFRENYKLVELLIEYDHQLEIMDSFGEKPIYTCSVKKPNLRMLNYLLDAGASCEYENETGLSLLSRAILNSTCFPVIKRLVIAGADVNHQDHFCKRTPLHMAAIIDSAPIAKLLIQHGADPDFRTIDGLTAFDLALYYKCFDTAEFLAVYTKNAALSFENFKDSLLSRLPNHGSALFLLRANASLPPNAKRNSYNEW